MEEKLAEWNCECVSVWYRIVNMKLCKFHMHVYIFVKKKKYTLRSLFARNFHYVSYFYQIFWYFYDGFLYFYYVSRCTISWNLNRNAPYKHTSLPSGTYTWSSLVRLLIFRAMFKVAFSWRIPTMREISTAHISFESFLHFPSSAQIHRRIHAKFLMNRLPTLRSSNICFWKRHIYYRTIVPFRIDNPLHKNKIVFCSTRLSIFLHHRRKFHVLSNNFLKSC